MIFKYDWANVLYPFSYLIYFSIYPLVYIYTKSLISEQSTKIFKTNWNYFVFPILIFILISVYYYHLPIGEKKECLSFDLSNTFKSKKNFSFIQIIIITGYYLQTFIFITFLFFLVRRLKKKISTEGIKLLIAKYILILVFGIIFFETSFIAINIFVESIVVLKIVESIVLICFILFGFYVAINQTIILIQTKLGIQAQYLISDHENSNNKRVNNKYDIKELNELKELILNYIKTTQIFLDPNLSIDTFSKKIHVQSRKISLVINNLFGKNFHNFINEFRIQEAIKIMDSENSIIIDELYTKVGFNSRSTFNRAFKEITGKSPSEYIENRKSV